jgi:hypothetical protein
MTSSAKLKGTFAPENNLKISLICIIDTKEIKLRANIDTAYNIGYYRISVDIADQVLLSIK